MDAGVPVIELDPALASFEEMKSWLDEHVAVEPHIHGRSCRLDIGDRAIHLFDLRRMVSGLRDGFSIDITGLYARPEAIRDFAQRELKLKLFILEDAGPEITEDTALLEPSDTQEEEAADDLPALVDDTDLGVSFAFDDAPEQTEESFQAPEPHESPAFFAAPPPDAKIDTGRRTLCLHRTLRSGAIVRFDGDVTLYGDVNPGAELVAAGNIVVLGALKGMAHAGATGEEACHILALSCMPTQLRIGTRIARLPDSPKTTGPAVATVSGTQITIQPYTGKLPASSLETP